MLRGVDRGLALVSWIAAALVVVLLFAGPSLIGAKRSAAPAAGSTAGGKTGGKTGGKAGGAQGGGRTSTGSTAAKPTGSAVFASAGCANCHTLKAAGATGSVGPDLDQLQPDASTVSDIVRSGGGGMPSFSGKLSDAETTAVASYVSSVAGH
jgi:mono/diheme cytochrome c family protein